MPVVSNISPISNLASIDRLNLLQIQFETVWIPAAVAAELSAHPNASASFRIQSALDAGWLKLHPVEESALPKMLRSQLDPGEAEAIALAQDTHADYVLIDEKEGRRLATQCGLSVTGVLGVLLSANKTGEIDSMQSEMEKLRTQAGFYISPSLATKVLQAAEDS
jgi:predicted nucleic acid-binding protein